MKVNLLGVRQTRLAELVWTGDGSLYEAAIFSAAEKFFTEVEKCPVKQQNWRLKTTWTLKRR